MQTEDIKTIAAYIAIAVPVTVAIANLARIGLEWLKQWHTIRAARIEQNHQITTQYLDRALDPTVPLAIRHQLLRFLATPEESGSRLSAWAESELKRVGGIVEDTNRAVVKAEAELHSAKSPAEVANAERNLEEAVRRQKSLLEAPATPPITPASLRAGLVEKKDLNGLSMPAADLSNAQLTYRQMRGADLTGANLANANLQGCDLRAANLTGATLTRVTFYDADLRGADLSEAEVSGTSFRSARLEGADMQCKMLQGIRIPATYDKSTRWPDGFDPVQAGAVMIESGSTD